MEQKDIKDMTLREIEDLQSQYKKEFCEVVEQFLAQRPMIDYIWLYQISCLCSNSAILNEKNLYSIVNKVHLKGEPR
jgi:hypothetical protein